MVLIFIGCGPTTASILYAILGVMMVDRRRMLVGSTTLLLQSAVHARAQSPNRNVFDGERAGAEREIASIRVCWCPPGRFLMGSAPGEPRHRTGSAQVPVTLTHGFWMGKFEVTQGQWRALYGAPPGPLIGGAGDDFPVYFVNYPQSEDFCRRLTAQARMAGTLPSDWRFDLPTEAQWEYACRAGTTTAYAFGDSLSTAQANIGKPYNGRATGVPGSAAAPVGSYPPNAWGLHDMHGNEFEWCKDWFHERLPGGVDPDLSQVRGTPNGDGSYSRARRGGAWTDAPEWNRSATRLPYEPQRNADHIGLRVAVVRAV